MEELTPDDDSACGCCARNNNLAGRSNDFGGLIIMFFTMFIISKDFRQECAQCRPVPLVSSDVRFQLLDKYDKGESRHVFIIILKCVPVTIFKTALQTRRITQKASVKAKIQM